MQPVEFPNGPFEHIALDVVGPFDCGPPDCRFAITMVHYFSKWPEVAFSANVTTETVVLFLQCEFARERDPCTVSTDNGPQFTSSAFTDFLVERGIKHIRTRIYHPQANGAVEMWNKVLKHFRVECWETVECSSSVTLSKEYSTAH